MTSDGEVLLRGYAVKCDVAPSKTRRHPKVLSPIFVEPWSKKIRSSNSSARNPLTRDLSSLGFVNAEWACLHHMLTEVIKSFQEGPNKLSVFELCGRHVVMLQMKVLQVANVRQIADNFLESFTV